MCVYTVSVYDTPMAATEFGVDDRYRDTGVILEVGGTYLTALGYLWYCW